MKQKITFLVLSIFISVTIRSQVNTNFETFSFTAQIYDSQIVNAEISSCLDNNKVTHIAWIKNDGTLRYLMYSKFSPVTKQFITTQLEAGTTEVKIAPKIITDSNNNPHIVYIMKRDPNKGISNGNYAVIYVGDGNGDGTFDILQVSANPKDPSTSVNSLYNCYVNDRPSIMLIGSDLYVSYISESNSLNSYNKYLIFAKKNGSSWTYSQEIKLESSTLGGTYNVDYGISFPSKASTIYYGGLIDISNYSPRIVYKSTGWNVVQIPGYSGSLGTNKHVTIVVDNSQKYHYMWYNTDNKKFCHTTLSNNTYGKIDEYAALSTSTGNLFPSTVDIEKGLPIYFYNLLNGSAKIIIENQEIELKNIGVGYGKDALHARNGFISLTTASEGNQKIYVSINSGTSSGINDLLLKDINIFPNPTTSHIQVSGIEGKANLTVFGIDGKLLLSKQFIGNEPISVSNLSNGIYTLRIQTTDGVVERKLVKK